MSLPAAFASKVTTEPTCHLWIGATNNKGYGILFIDGRHHLAHRLAYEAEYGPIPDGMVLDHVCRSRNCVNPLHLEVVTHAENARRGRRAASLQIGDTCSNGHLIGPGDLYERKSGKTECRHCRRAVDHKGSGPRPTTQRHAAHVARDLDTLAEVSA